MQHLVVRRIRLVHALDHADDRLFQHLLRELAGEQVVDGGIEVGIGFAQARIAVRRHQESAGAAVVAGVASVGAAFFAQRHVQQLVGHQLGGDCQCGGAVFLHHRRAIRHHAMVDLADRVQAGVFQRDGVELGRHGGDGCLRSRQLEQAAQCFAVGAGARRQDGRGDRDHALMQCIQAASNVRQAFRRFAQFQQLALERQAGGAADDILEAAQHRQRCGGGQHGVAVARLRQAVQAVLHLAVDQERQAFMFVEARFGQAARDQLRDVRVFFAQAAGGEPQLHAQVAARVLGGVEIEVVRRGHALAPGIGVFVVHVAHAQLRDQVHPQAQPRPVFDREAGNVVADAQIRQPVGGNLERQHDGVAGVGQWRRQR